LSNNEFPTNAFRTSFIQPGQGLNLEPDIMRFYTNEILLLPLHDVAFYDITWQEVFKISKTYTTLISGTDKIYLSLRINR